MAMVGSSSATQASARPSWSSAPQSSTPPEAEENLTQQAFSTISANLHGVIGEHRRNSRSSSVSSGGSSGNATDGTSDSSRQARLAAMSAQSTNQENMPLEHQAKHILQHIDMHPAGASGDEIQDINGKDKDKQNLPNMESPHTNGLGMKTEISSTEADIVSQLNLLSTNQSPINTVQLGHLMDGPRSADQQGFIRPQPAMASGQGRTVTGNPAPGAFNNSSSVLDQMNCVVGGYVQNFNTSIKNDFDSMGFTKFMDKYGSNGVSSPTANIGTSNEANSMGSGFQSPRSFQTNGSTGGFSSNGSHQFMNSNPFPSMGNNVFGSTQNAMSQNGFYSSANSFSSGQNYYPSQNTNGNYFGHSQMAQFQGFNSHQDFSLPPPSHVGWQNGPYSPSLSDPMMEKIICRGCQKPFKWPTTLDCMHVFCFNCICNKLSSTAQLNSTAPQSICCTFCNRTSPVAQGAYNLLLDYALCRYMTKMKLSPFACTACSRETDAVTLCTTCPSYLCGECQERHMTMRYFSNHVLVPINKVVKQNGEYEPMCEKHHGEALDKYCVTCPQMICDKCTPDHLHPDSTNAPTNHDLQESYNIVIPRLKKWNEDACIKHKEAVEVKKKIPEIKASIDNRKRITRRAIDEYVDYLKNVIEQNRSSAQDMIDRSADQVENHLIKLTKLVDEIESELEAVSAFNTFTLEEGTPAQVMNSLANMESSYKRAIEEYSEVCLKNNGEGMTFEFCFNPDYPKTNEFIQENFAALTYKINDNEFNVGPMPLRTDMSRNRVFTDYSSNDNSDCNYQRWSAAPDSMSISTWNGGNERDRKGTFIPYLNRCRTRTSFVHVFGDYGRGEYAFTEPSGQAYFEDGSYVICDTNNHRIVYYSKDHEFVRSIGQPPNLPALAEDHEIGKGGPRGKGFTRQDGYLYFPNRVAICPVTKHIVATERPPSHDVQIFTIDGDFVRCFGGNVLQHPRGVTVDENGVIIVVECKVMKLTMFDYDGNQLASHSLAKDLEFPNDVAAKDGKIYISDNRGHCVSVFDYEAKFLSKIGNDSITYFPIGVSINSLNQVVVTDNHNTFNITVFDMEGRVVNIFESITKHAQCHNVAVHPTKLELMLTTKDCNVYFFNYDPNSQHPPQAATSRGPTNYLLNRRARSNGNGNHSSANYF